MSALTVFQGDEVLRVDLSGALDDEIGTQLVELTAIALSVSPEVVIDVSAVTEWTPDGLEALLECADLGAQVPSGTPAEPPDR